LSNGDGAKNCKNTFRIIEDRLTLLKDTSKQYVKRNWISDKIINPVFSIFGKIGGIVVTVMMFLTFLDVSLRYFLNKPIHGSLELTEFMMALLVSCSLSYTASKKGHIRVDLVLHYASKRVSRIIDVFTYAISAAFYIPDMLASLAKWESLNG